MPNKRKETLTSSYSRHGQKLETRSTSKYLGINISSDLSWSTHVEDIVARGNRTVGFLRRNFRKYTTKVKSATYTRINANANGTPHTVVRGFQREIGKRKFRSNVPSCLPVGLGNRKAHSQLLERNTQKL
ncbi:hypothetical protein LSAT2_022460 [Lamellibrachia satsuma]|nr:hypothetical protein LSAT2_022460 [Lamellibrachia satsuma]